MDSIINKLPTLNYTRMKKSIIQKIKHTEQVSCIVSTTGFGKTTLIKELAKEDGLNYEVVSINCALLQEGDLYFPYIKKEFKESNEVLKLREKLFLGGYKSLSEDDLLLLRDSSNLPSEEVTNVDMLLHPSLAKIVKNYELNGVNSILFMDELGNLKTDVMSEVMNLILDKEVMGKTLPEGTKIISAMNPSNSIEGYEMTNYSTIEFTDAFNSRLTFLFMDVELSDWLNSFAYNINPKTNKQNIHNTVINFLKSHEQFFKTDLEDDSYLNELNTPNPRNWENVSEYIYIQEDNGYNDLDILESDIFGKVGGQVSIEFIKYYKDAPLYLDILELIELSKTSKKLDKKSKEKISNMSEYALNINTENIIMQVIKNPYYNYLIDNSNFTSILLEMVLMVGDEGYASLTEMVFNENNCEDNIHCKKLSDVFKENDDYIMKYINSNKEFV